MRRHVIAKRLHLGARKRVIDAFQLLQADDIGLALAKPPREMLDDAGEWN